MRKLFIALNSVIIILNSFCFSQNLDSLWKVYNNKAQVDTNRLNALDVIARYYSNNNLDTAISLATQELNFANSLSNEKGKKWTASAIFIMGSSYANNGNSSKSFEFYFKSLKIWEELGIKKSIGICYNNIGNAYMQQSNYPKALEYYFKGLKIREDIGDKRGMAYANNNIGIVYWHQSNYSKALEYQLKSLHLSEEIGNKKGVASSLNNIGILYKEQSGYPKALEYYLKALQIFEEINDKQYAANTNNNIGSVYVLLNKPETALEYYLKALKASRETNYKVGINNSYIGIAELYNAQANYKLAITYSDSALRMSKEMEDIDAEKDVYKNLAVAYSKTGMYKDAYENHVKFKQLTDSIFNTENSKQLGDLKTQFEVEKKEAELKIKAEAQQAVTAEEKKKQQIIIYSVIGVLLLVIVFSVFLLNRFRITQRQKKVIEEQKKLVDKAYNDLHEKNKQVIDSIYYARRIQNALITSEKYITTQLNRLKKVHLLIVFTLMYGVNIFSQNYSEDVNKAFVKGKSMKNIPSVETVFMEGTQWELIANSITVGLKLKTEKKVKKFLTGNVQQINEENELGNVTYKSKNVMEVSFSENEYESDKLIAFKNDTIVVEIKSFSRDDKNGWYDLKKEYREIYVKSK